MRYANKYWMSPVGDWNRLEDHESWSMKKFGGKEPPHGWIRIAIEDGALFAPMRKCTNLQRREIKDFAIMHELEVVDDVNGRPFTV